jgi:Tfp pilus assembly protein FimT
VLLVGVLTAVAMPKYFASLDSFRVDAASRRVAADLRIARAYALKTSTTQTVDFDATADSYAIAGMPDPNRPSSTYSVNLATSQYAVDVQSAAFGSGDLIQFDMYGKPDNTGSVVVKSGSKQRTIAVDAVGAVSIN